MQNVTNLWGNINSDIKQLITTLENLQTEYNMVADDTGLPAALATFANGRGWNISAQDVTNAMAAVNQILFTFNSGSPTQASLLYKLQ